MEERLEKIEEMLSELSSKLDDLTDDIESTIEDAVEDAVISATANFRSSEPAVLLTILTQDGKSILSVHAVKARRMKKDAEEYGIFVCWCDNNECAGKYPNKAAALAEIEKMTKHISAGLKTIYRMN